MTTDSGLAFLANCDKLRTVILNDAGDEYDYEDRYFGITGKGIANLLIALPKVNEYIYSFILKLKFKSNLYCVWFLMLNTTNIYLIPALATYVRTVSAAWGNQICAHNQCQCVDLQTDVPSYPISWSRFFDVCHISLSWYQGKIHLYYNLLILFYIKYHE